LCVSICIISLCSDPYFRFCFDPWVLLRLVLWVAIFLLWVSIRSWIPTAFGGLQCEISALFRRFLLLFATSAGYVWFIDHMHNFCILKGSISRSVQRMSICPSSKPEAGFRREPTIFVASRRVVFYWFMTSFVVCLSCWLVYITLSFCAFLFSFVSFCCSVD
jgi:hypothetical protein